MVEELKNSQENHNKSDFLKLKKELSEKERHINSQNLAIDKLKSEISELKNKISDLQKLEKAMDNSYPVITNKEMIAPLNNFDLNDAKPRNLDFNSVNLNNENLFENDFSKENLLKENQYLTKKFKKYQNKYTKFKFKYEELKSLIQILAPGNFLYNMDQARNRIEDYNLNPQIQPVFLSNKVRRSDEVDKSKRKGKNVKDFKIITSLDNLSEKFENKNELESQRKISLNRIESSDIFEKDNLSLIGHEIKSLCDDEPLMNADEDNLDKNYLESNQKEKSTKKKKNVKKTEKMQKEEKLEKNTKKEKKEKKVQKPEKEKKSKNLKRKKTNVEESHENNLEIQKEENLKAGIKEIQPKENIKSEISRVHINPIKKSKFPADDLSELKKKKEELENELINFINNLSVTDTSNEEIIKFFDNYAYNWTSHEKIFNILEIIFPNAHRIDFMKTIFLLCNFPLDLFLFNIKEFILSHVNIILSKENVNFLSNSSDEEKKIVLKNYFNFEGPQIEFDLQNFTSAPILVSFILAILYLKLNDHSEFIKFIFDILEIYNEKFGKILGLFGKLIKRSNNPITIQNESELENYTTNFNKIYFMHTYRKVFISKTLADFIFDYFVYKEQSEHNLDEFIIGYLGKILGEINDNVELKEIKFHKINFAIDVRYLEIFQIIYLLFKIKSLEWIYKNIFEAFLWSCFLKSKEGSVKRVAIIFYISYIMSNFIAKDLKCENENTKNLINWIYAIFDPKFNSQMISAYDRIAALSGFIDTHVIQFDKNAFALVKSIIEKIIQEHGIEIIPEDFVEKLKKLNLFSDI